MPAINQDATKLRRSAEARVKKKAGHKETVPNAEDARRLLHELQVHQIELEMQNEELQRAKSVAEATLESYTELYDFAPISYCTLGHTGDIRRVNIAAAGLLGRERSKLTGVDFRMFIGDRDRFAFADFLGRVFSGTGNNTCELVLKCGSDTSRIVHVEAGADTQGQTCRLTMVDITERKQIEQEMKLNARKLETLQKQQIAMHTAAAIAHELNQPLLAIASYSKAVQMMLGTASPDQDKINAALAATEQQANRAGQFIRQLLEFLAMDKFPMEALDLNREILNVLNTARREHEMRFQSKLHLEEGLPPILANRTHVQKVLLNLIHNSIESMQQVGIPLPALIITVRTIKDAGVAQVTIQDNGPGFNAEIIRQLFKPFFTTKPGGIGIGLSISRSLVEANGGQLWVDPQKGPGATVHLTLPFAP